MQPDIPTRENAQRQVTDLEARLVAAKETLDKWGSDDLPIGNITIRYVPQYIEYCLVVDTPRGERFVPLRS